MFDHSHINGLNQIDVFVYAYPHAKNQLHTYSKFFLINFTPMFILTCCFKSLWACLTIPTCNDWKKMLLLLILYHMQKTNVITQLILKIKLTRYSSSLWAFRGNICCFHGPLVTSKNSTSAYLWDILVQRILHSDWLWGFWTIIQEPDFSQTCCFCQKLKDLWNFHVKAVISELIRFLLKPRKTSFCGDFLCPLSPSELLIKNHDLSLFLP